MIFHSIIQIPITLFPLSTYWALNLFFNKTRHSKDNPIHCTQRIHLLTYNNIRFRSRLCFFFLRNRIEITVMILRVEFQLILRFAEYLQWEQWMTSFEAVKSLASKFTYRILLFYLEKETTRANSIHFIRPNTKNCYKREVKLFDYVHRRSSLWLIIYFFSFYTVSIVFINEAVIGDLSYHRL